jgi:hypothetical protein
VRLLDQESGLRRACEKHLKIAGQSMAPPALRKGRLIVIDQDIVQRVLAGLPPTVLAELRARFPDEEESELPTPSDREEEGMGLVAKDDGWRMPDWLWERIGPLLPPSPPHLLGFTGRGCRTATRWMRSCWCSERGCNGTR